MLSIIGSNDVHGVLLPQENRGGLVTLSGYVDALRAARRNGAVLLIDAGDMWQGTLESNLTEGAAVVAIYNAMGYVAAAIGNHEFDFGPEGPKATPTDAGDDPRGALKRRAREAQFPLLAANLIDDSTGARVDWLNVRSSIVVEAAGVDVGIIGVVTADALQTTIAANVGGLRIAPLADTIRREAESLRAAGADIVIVTAHAGGRCHEFTNPADTSSCEADAEIVRVANALPAGLVDHIVGGHVHDGVAHVFNGVSVTSAHSHTYAFSRVDFLVDPATGRILERRIFPPQPACPFHVDGTCAWAPAPGARAAVYEGHAVVPDAAVAEIAERAAAAALARKREPLGPVLETPFTLKGNPESALGNLMTDALLQSMDADVAIHNVSGGIRAILPAGPLSFGAVYEMFPFDNRVVVLELSGRELREVIAAQAYKSRRRAGISGLQVTIECRSEVMQVDMRLSDGRIVDDDMRVRVVANDFLALGGDDILTPAIPPGGFAIDDSLPLTRDVLVDWFREQRRLRAEDFLRDGNPNWRGDRDVPSSCRLEDGRVAAQRLR